MFKTIFEAQLIATLVDEGKSVNIGGVNFSPAAILSRDEVAHQDSYKSWLVEEWYPEQQIILDRIWAVSRDNKNHFNDLCESYKREQVIPFVGSGMSASSSLPIWSNLLLDIAKSSRSPDDVCPHVESFIESGKFEEAFDLFRNPDVITTKKLTKKIKHCLQLSDDAQIEGAIRLLPELFNTIIITTNLDKLIETLYSRYDRNMDSVFIGSDVCRHRDHRTSLKRILLKLHGDIEYPNTQILGSNEYSHAYSPDSDIYTELKFIYQAHNLLFLGCSLNQDRTVNLLSSVASEDKNMPDHYAFLHAGNDDAIRRDREHFLTERGIYPIWYPDDHDESIQALFTEILHYAGKLGQ